ncbi:hypothetical protein SARC_04197 [Sphaeroforma arctica JP610]|uniref:Uncharacterized protein n=1 Tax=Sphaeroforma arctica JP610 TaxID=667725 RepID=A0A0L0G397_9EUKA|nr:hypothetical protein SARC_04197 [Sphaeroforma arctica JP610]KNC83550.1 hypothetical protein SARC_04197 [Sphaeroforma arctica JP610]|eukprot:XP_014157452.1 hypothetical protein SARC_04197 [Sphaeroforma arctica JP610]
MQNSEKYSWPFSKIELSYGVQVPGPDDRPTLKRSNGILFDKKAISWYMPRNNMEWDLVEETGNPTKSPQLNTLIKQVTKFELRGEGALEKIVSIGHSAQDAIDKIETAYGMQLSVSAICRALKNNKELTQVQPNPQQQQQMG